MYEVGDRLHWVDDICFDQDGNDVPMDAPERDAEVTFVEDDGTVHVRFGDGLEDYYPMKNMPDFFERVVN